MISISMQCFGGRGSRAGASPRSSSSQRGMRQLGDMSFEEFESTIDGLFDPESGRYNSGLDSSYYMQNGTQALIKQFGINDKPQVVGKGEVDAIAAENGTPVLYRGLVNSSKMTSQEIANQMLNDPNNRIGGGVFGDGFYFSPSLNMAEQYAGNSGTIVKATLNPKTAKVIEHKDVLKEMEKYSQHPTKHTLTDKLWDVCDSPQWGNQGESVMALKMGYNVIKAGNNKYVVIDRGALVVEEV